MPKRICFVDIDDTIVKTLRLEIALPWFAKTTGDKSIRDFLEYIRSTEMTNEEYLGHVAKLFNKPGFVIANYGGQVYISKLRPFVPKFLLELGKHCDEIKALTIGIHPLQTSILAKHGLLELASNVCSPYGRIDTKDAHIVLVDDTEVGSRKFFLKFASVGLIGDTSGMKHDELVTLQGRVDSYCYVRAQKYLGTEDDNHLMSLMPDIIRKFQQQGMYKESV